MHNDNKLVKLLLAAALAAPLSALAQTPGAPAEPDVYRRPVKLPRFPSNDFEVGLFGGTYSTQNFGASGVAGLRLGYHLSEDFFVQAAFAQTKVSDETFRQILPGGIFVDPKSRLRYYNVSVGVNVLPGEVFVGRTRAFRSAMYLIGGIGSTRFVDQRRQTINVGFGTRVMFADWFSLQIDLRDHIYQLDLLGRRDSTQNLELTGGLSFYF
jgi:outer membrane beta-barrel protein